MEEELGVFSRISEIIDLGKKVFGDEDKFISWVSKPEHRTLTYTFEGLDQLEEKLIQLDEGYCL